MTKWYLIPVLSKDIFIGDYSLYDVSESINPLLVELDSTREIDNNTLSLLCDFNNIPKELVAFSDGNLLYESETTAKLQGEEQSLGKYRVNSLEALEVFVKNENYADQASIFIKQAKSLKSDEKKLFK